MAKKKKLSTAAASQKQKHGFFRRLVVPRPRVVVALVVVSLLGWAMQNLWQRIAPRVIYRDRYLLSEERITISPQPEYIRADIAKNVIRNSGLDQRLSVLDDEFMRVVEDAFALNPWVESVHRITKCYPPGVHVELTYRRPVAVVEMATDDGSELIPIDKYGVHLPAEEFPEIRKRYLPRIGGIVERPPVGQPWSDPRIYGAAELASRLADVWESLHLVDILPSARPEIRQGHRYFVFDLITSGGTCIVWGAAPSCAPPGEDKFQEKLRRLKNCIQQHGPLDSVRGPAQVDVRRQLSITPRTVKKEKPVDDETPIVK